MADLKENQIELKPTYQSKPYRSWEQKYFVDSGIRDFLVYSGKGFYGAVASMFRVPTLIRKMINDQCFIVRENLKDIKLDESALGGILGVIGDVGFFTYSVISAGKGNYFPLEILAATNLLSGAYELGRFSRSKQERLEVKAQMEAEKAQQKTEGEIKEAEDFLEKQVEKTD